jgi:hypothetical protein
MWRECVKLFHRAGFVIKSVTPVENMPIFSKFAVFGTPSNRMFDESCIRDEGYRLSGRGQLLQDIPLRSLPERF